VTTEGVPQVLREFANLSAKMQRAVLRDALRSGARVVVASAKTKVPVRTGALKRGITHRVTVPQNGLGEATIGYDSKQFYGRFVELGTSRQAARPFLRPALDATQNQVEKVFREAVERGIENKTAALGGSDG
jgi:HK97 gp10 family phage protein